ncbi:hypothetical protein JCM19038_2766 [Geomicrobium sp. JCM 19038]|nr:hypothetical protein JCM19038_2766 [Geomicrobium sp. JCM 19038]
MRSNLKFEMKERNIKTKQLAEFLEVRYATVLDKINGHYDFSYKECVQIKRKFFPGMSMEYLFALDSDEDELCHNVKEA